VNWGGSRNKNGRLLHVGCVRSLRSDGLCKESTADYGRAIFSSAERSIFPALGREPSIRAIRAYTDESSEEFVADMNFNFE
jgi:hypothetical protein